jgi:hypothetical protein
MTQRFGSNLTAIAIALLLVAQASLAASGMSFVRDLASNAHAQLAAVAKASR